MTQILSFLQTYGVWIVLGGVVLVMMTRGGSGMGCCGMPQQGRGMASGCGQGAASDDSAGTELRPTTAAEARAQLSELRARQEALARQIAELEREPAAPAREGQVAIRPARPVGREDARR